jgi:hypothetical protein
MPYIFYILGGLLIVSIIVRKLHDRSEKKRLRDNCNLHSKKHKEYYRGKPFNNEWKQLYDDVHNN